MHPLTRLVIVTGLSVLSVTLTNNYILLALTGFSAILVMFKFRTVSENRRLLKYLRNLLSVVFSLFIIQLVFNRQGNPIHLFWGLTITSLGLSTAINVTLRLLILLFSAAWVMGMPSREFLVAFMTLGVPETFSVLVMLTLGWLPLLSGKVKQSLRQIRYRGIIIRRIGLRQKLRLYIGLILPILGWTLKDLNYRAIALDLRGFRSGRKPVHYLQRSLRVMDWLVIIPVVGLAVVLPFLI